MDRQRSDADVFESPREIHDRHVRLGSQANARLHGHGQRDRAHDRTGHRDHRRGIAQPSGTCACLRDVWHPATAVDIEERGLHTFGDLRGFEQSLRIRAVDLDRGRSIIGRECELAARDLRVRDHVIDMHELGDAQLGADRSTRATKRGVGDVFHRSEDDRRPSQEIAQCHQRCRLPKAISNAYAASVSDGIEWCGVVATGSVPIEQPASAKQRTRSIRLTISA